MAVGFQCKYSFVSATHKQCSAKFGQSMLLPGKLSPKLLNANAHQLVFWIWCLNLHKTQHRASTWGRARKQHKVASPVTSAGSRSIAVRANHRLQIFHRLGKTSHLALPSPCGIVFTVSFPGVEDTFHIQDLCLADGLMSCAQTSLGLSGLRLYQLLGNS